MGSSEYSAERLDWMTDSTLHFYAADVAIIIIIIIVVVVNSFITLSSSVGDKNT